MRMQGQGIEQRAQEGTNRVLMEGMVRGGSGFHSYLLPTCSGNPGGSQAERHSGGRRRARKGGESHGADCLWMVEEVPNDCWRRSGEPA